MGRIQAGRGLCFLLYYQEISELSAGKEIKKGDVKLLSGSNLPPVYATNCM
jgi:hypothetical protein